MSRLLCQNINDIIKFYDLTDEEQIKLSGPTNLKNENYKQKMEKEIIKIVDKFLNYGQNPGIYAPCLIIAPHILGDAIELWRDGKIN